MNMVFRKEFFPFLLKMNTVICCILAVEQLLLGVHER